MAPRPRFVGEGTVLEAAPRPLLDGVDAGIPSPNSLFADDVWIGHGCVLQSGVVLDAGVIIGDGCLVESDVRVGSHSLLTYRAHVCCEVSIGAHCVIGGFIGERTTVKDHSRVFGSIVHHHLDPTLPWDAPSSMEDAATIHEYVMIAFGAIITRPVSIGPRAYVCAGAVVSRDVPTGHIAHGINKICPAGEWNGALRQSPLFAADDGDHQP